MARFNVPGMVYLDDNGKPLGGGKYYFYDTGTSTPKTTYSDEGETSANSNPVVLAADGRMGDVFFTGQARAVLKTSADVLIEDLDPVAGENS